MIVLYTSYTITREEGADGSDYIPITGEPARKTKYLKRELKRKKVWERMVRLVNI